jgi:hypothetical protein
MDELFADLIKAILPLLRDAKTVGTTVFFSACTILLLVARHLSKKTTSDFQAAARRIESEPAPALPAGHELAVLKLELETMRVRMERAEWAAKEWQLQGVKVQAELNQTAAELSTVRKSLAVYELADEQQAERALASETTERVRVWPVQPPALPAPALKKLGQARPTPAPKKRPRQET